MLLRDVHPICAEILDGAHDEILEAMEQAVASRKKRRVREAGLFKGGAIRIKFSVPDIGGAEGRVVRINKRTVTVRLTNGTEWRVPTSLVESAGAAKAAMEFAAGVLD